MAKEIRYGFSGITVRVETESIERLVRIFNAECERIVQYWLTDEDWAQTFERNKDDCWMFQDLHGLARAMYFMDLIENVDWEGADYIYDFCRAEVERRRDESNN